MHKLCLNSLFTFADEQIASCVILYRLWSQNYWKQSGLFVVVGSLVATLELWIEMALRKEGVFGKQKQ